MALAPLSSLDGYDLLHEDQDVRGWEVRDATGKVLGKVEELIVDTDADRVATIRLTNRAQYRVEDITIGEDAVVLDAAGAQLPDPAGMTSAEVRVPVVEERLQVGKREVETGGVRVSTQVTDQPVQAQVRLHEEQVEVTRRPVDRRPATAAELATMGERQLEVVENAEVPVIVKRRRVVEEILVKKDVAETTQTVRDTVRRTDVEVQEIAAAERPQRKSSS